MKHNLLGRHTLNQKNSFFSSAVIFLLLGILFVVSFFQSSTKGITPVKSALLNQKYKTVADSIEITDSVKNEKITLFKQNGFWLGKSDGDTIVFPVDQKIPTNFLDKLSQLIDMYKISDNTKYWKDFGLDKPLFSLKVSGTGGGIYTTIYFGKNNFDLSSVFIRAGTGIDTYKIERGIMDYISTSTRFWSDPGLIPENILDLSDEDIQGMTFTDRKDIYNIIPSQNDYKEKIHKITELRHGGIQMREDLKKSMESSSELIVKTGNGTLIYLLFYADEKDTSDYTVQYRYELGTPDRGKYSRIIPVLNYQTKISKWTFTSLLNYFEK